jgi:hypothetical protein
VSWCAKFPRVKPARSIVPVPVTLILPFYANHQFFEEQVQRWQHEVYRPFRPYVSVVVVDDGSPEPVCLPLEDERPFSMRLFRIGQDVRWNWLAARNIGAHEAADGWLLLTDMDHVVPPETLEAVIFGVRRTDTIYAFSRREHSGAVLEPHKNSFLMTRAMFWKVGGYDEALSGFYGTDGDWRRRCAATAPLAVLTHELIRHEFVGDSSTTRYLRKQPEDRAVRDLIHARGADWRPKVLSFPYVEVL